MSLYELIIAEFPELEGKIIFREGIWLQNDSDGRGDYILKWEYSKPIPKNLEGFVRS